MALDTSADGRDAPDPSATYTRRQLAERFRIGLGFEPKDCTRWLEPMELVRTGIKVGLAGAFAAYADKRELQASFPDAPLDLRGGDRDDAGDFWFDFVADLGDGFDATYTVASVVAADAVTVTEPGTGQQRTLPAGELLVLGGDEVYPAASAAGYEDRTTGPYRAALPTDAGGATRAVLAIPGNHDWYDGLTSFLRTFAQGRTFGGWRTIQDRSYYVVRLPHDWWLVGLDTQLADNIDQPQLNYLRRHLADELARTAGRPTQGIIVVTASPTWMHTVGKADPDAFNTLHFVERQYLRRDSDAGGAGARVRLWLTGDAHHYARWTEVAPDGAADSADDDRRATRFVTCGLGGAYLGGTHHVPAELELPPAGSRMRDRDPVPRRFRLGNVLYPSVKDSRRQAWALTRPGARWLLRRNAGFVAFMAAVQMLLFLLMSPLYGVLQGVEPATDGEVAGSVSSAVAGALRTTGWLIVVLYGLAALAWLLRRAGTRGPDRERRRSARSLARSALSAVLLVAPQIALAGLALTGTVALLYREWPHLGAFLLGLVVAGAVGGPLGAWAFAFFVRSAQGGQVADWQLSGQSIEDHKGFLRIRVGADGVEVFPLIVDTICRDWRLVDDPTGGDGAVRPVPAAPPVVRQLEPSFLVGREGF